MPFFAQLLLPLRDAAKLGIEGGKRMNCCGLCEAFSDAHASKTKAISSCSYASDPALIKDLAHFDGMISRDGCAREGDGDLHRRWDKSNSKCDPEIVQLMPSARFSKIKRSNSNCKAPSRDSTDDKSVIF